MRVSVKLNILWFGYCVQQRVQAVFHFGAAGPNRPGEDYMLICKFQWQNEEQVIVYPKELMEEAGSTYTYPDWPGPWD